jgi:hypothetical protein
MTAAPAHSFRLLKSARARISATSRSIRCLIVWKRGSLLSPARRGSLSRKNASFHPACPVHFSTRLAVAHSAETVKKRFTASLPIT